MIRTKYFPLTTNSVKWIEDFLFDRFAVKLNIYKSLDHIELSIDGSESKLIFLDNTPFFYNDINGNNLSNFINSSIKNKWLENNYNSIFKEYLRLMYVATTRSQKDFYIFGSYPLETNSLLFYLQNMKNSKE